MVVRIDVETTPEAAPVVERAGLARLVVFGPMLLPMVVVLVGFVGGSFNPATRAVARLAALAVLVGLVSSMRRWPVAVTSACLAVYSVGILWVLALPDGRHPTLMAVALLSGALVAVEPFLDGIEARDRTVFVPVVVIAVVTVSVWILAMSPVPLRMKITTAQATIDAQAARDLSESAVGARMGEPPRPSFDCVDGQVPNLDLGPFPVCRRFVDGDRSQVAYDLGKPFLGLGDKTTAGLVYAPDGSPRLDDACTAPITGPWFEFSRPADGGACPPGQKRPGS